MKIRLTCSRRKQWNGPSHPPASAVVVRRQKRGCQTAHRFALPESCVAFSHDPRRRPTSTVRALYQVAATDARQQYLLKLWLITTALLSTAQEVMRDDVLRP